MLRLLTRLVLLLALGFFVPGEAAARAATCVGLPDGSAEKLASWGSAPEIAVLRQAAAMQAAEMQQGSASHSYEVASIYSLAAESDTALLQGHLDNAIARFNSDAGGFTAAQERALLNNPDLEAAFRGERIDAFFRESVGQDSALDHLELTPRGQFGPDVFNPETQEWWDVTTPGQWDAHVQKYWLFGNGTPLLH